MVKQKTELSTSAQSDVIEVRKRYDAHNKRTALQIKDFGDYLQGLHDKYASHNSGTFLRVLKEAGVPRQSAYGFMAVAKSRFSNVGNLVPPQVAYKLTSDKVPEAAEEEALERAESGEHITAQVASEIIKKHSEPEGDEPAPKKAEPAKDGVTLDMLDRPIPKSLIEVFSQKALYQEIETILNNAIHKTEALAALPSGAHISAQGIKRIIDDAKREVRLNKPYTVCPYCKGKKSSCAACKESGWVPKRIYETAPEEKK